MPRVRKVPAPSRKPLVMMLLAAALVVRWKSVNRSIAPSLPLASGLVVPAEPPRDSLGNEPAQASCLSFKAFGVLLDLLHLGVRQSYSSLPLAGLALLQVITWPPHKPT